MDLRQKRFDQVEDISEKIVLREKRGERDRGRERERMESFQLVERIVLRIGFKEFVVVTHKN